jgi:outer membrane cobalamin receptor
VIRPATLLLLLVPGAAAAQQEIVVTGRGLEAGLGSAAYDVSEIGRERLAHSASDRLEDVLRDVPGFQQFRRSDARSANPTSQGATLRALGGNASSRALLLLDGVPQTDPFGGWIAWPAYDPRRLGRIRVVRGGGSGADGPGALAGTIVMESALPGETEGPAAGLFYGSRDSVDAYASYGGRLGAGFVTIAGAYARGDGFVPVVARQRGPADRPSPYRQGSIGAARGDAAFSDGRAAGEPLGLQRRSRARHRVQRDLGRRRGRLATAGRPRPLPLLFARLRADARLLQPIRLGQCRPHRGDRDARPI